MSTDVHRPAQREYTRVFPLLLGAVTAQAVAVFAELGVADHLDDEARSAEELAAGLSLDANALGRLLRALATSGVVGEPEPGRFRATPESEMLRDDHPSSLRAMARFGGGVLHRSLARLAEGVRTGIPGFELAHGQPFYEWLADHPDEEELFQRSMTDTADMHYRMSGLLDAYAWRGDETVVDVGGGEGALLAALLQRHPRMRGVLFDLPAVVTRAASALEAAGVADRCEIVGGSFFERVPAGGDVYVLARVVFNWDDTDATNVLRRCRWAMPTHARLLVAEWLSPESAAVQATNVNDLSALLIGGRLRSPAQWAALLDAAGFGAPTVLASNGGGELSLVEVTAP